VTATQSSTNDFSLANAWSHCSETRSRYVLICSIGSTSNSNRLSRPARVLRTTPALSSTRRCLVIACRERFDSLALRAATKPSASLLAKLKQHKVEIVALLRQEECSAWPLEPDEAELEERAPWRWPACLSFISTHGRGSNAKSRRMSRMAIGGKPSMTLASS
jgi:hypothetical protein